jgi:hypothetical protein
MDVFIWLAFKKQDGLCRGCRTLCSVRPAIRGHPAGLGLRAFLLGTPASAVDLRTGALKGADPSDETMTDVNAVIGRGWSRVAGHTAYSITSPGRLRSPLATSNTSATQTSGA